MLFLVDVILLILMIRGEQRFRIRDMRGPVSEELIRSFRDVPATELIDEKRKMDHLRIFQHHPRLGYVFKPLVSGVEWHGKVVAKFSTNKEGFRKITAGTSAAPSTSSRPIVFVGGSFTYGQFVENEEAFPAQFAQRAEAQTVINAGHPGWGMAHVLALIEEVLLKKTPVPAVILYGYIGDHLNRTILELEEVSRSELFITTSTPLYLIKNGRPRFSRICSSKIIPMQYERGVHVAEERVAVLLEEAHRITKNKGVKFIVLKLYSAQSKANARKERLLMERLSRRGIQVVDVESRVRRLADERGIAATRLLNVDQGHPSAAWHKLVAEILLNHPFLPDLCRAIQFEAVGGGHAG